MLRAPRKQKAPGAGDLCLADNRAPGRFPLWTLLLGGNAGDVVKRAEDPGDADDEEGDSGCEVTGVHGASPLVSDPFDRGV